MKPIDAGDDAADLSVYVAKYVRITLENPGKRKALLQSLSEHKPFVEAEFMAVAMIDISGFSSLMSLFSDTLGKLSSEVISAGVGEYIEKIAPLVLDYGGDIVKFLGDAILCTFTALHEDEDESSIIQRALLCCVAVLLKHPTLEIDVKRWTNAINSVRDVAVRLDSGNMQRRLKNSKTLSLHAGLTAGMVSHVVVGIPDVRLDYFVAAPCFHDLGALLDNAKSGQLGISSRVIPVLPTVMQSVNQKNGQVILHNEHLEAIRSYFIKDEVEHGIMLSRPELEISGLVSETSQRLSSEMNVLSLFINQSVVFRRKGLTASNTVKSTSEMQTRSVHSFNSEYRTVTVLFIKPLSSSGFEETQIQIEEFLKSLNEFKGVFHQCSGDVFNLAVRLLSIMRQNFLIAIDQNTRDIVKKEFDCVHLGKHEVKGKCYKVDVWGISTSTRGNTIKLPAKSYHSGKALGNTKENLALKNSYLSWATGNLPKYSILVEGFSGMGKSSMLLNVKKYVAENNMDTCVGRGTEMGQTLPFGIVQILLQQLLDGCSATSPKKSKGCKSYLSMMSENDWQQSQNLRRKSACDRFQESRVQEVLVELGEDPSYATLFNEIVGSKKTRKLSEEEAGPVHAKRYQTEAEERRNLLKSLVVKVIAHLLAKYRILMLIDDAQWVDPISLDILCAVTDLIDYQAVFHNTGGNLLQVDTLIAYLADEMEDKYLDDCSLESIVTSRIETLILAQFDRLDDFIQTVFKYASILGHYFSMEDLLFLLNNPSLTPALLEDDIVAGDRFGFMSIEKINNGLTPYSNIHFRHITIARSIYESIPMVDRQMLHSSIAEYYESFIDDDRDEKKGFVPLMCFHFWRSANVEKKIGKNLELGLSYFDDALYPEATSLLSDIIQFMSENEAGMETKYIRATTSCTQLPREVKADALAKLSWSSVNILPFSKSRAYAIQALELSGMIWPRTPKEVKKATLLYLKRLLVGWLRSKGGMVDIGRKGGKGGSKSILRQQKRHNTIKLALITLTLLAILDGSVEPDIGFLIVILNVNHGMLQCDTDPEYWFYSLLLSSSSLARFNLGYRIGFKLFKVCQKVEKKCGMGIHANFHLYGAMMTEYVSSPRIGAEKTKLHAAYWCNRKVELEWLKQKPMLFVSTFMMGDLNAISCDLNEGLITQMLTKDMAWTTAAMNCAIFEGFFTENISAMEQWNTILKQGPRDIPDQALFLFGRVSGIGDFLISIASKTHHHEFLENFTDLVIRLATINLADNHFYGLLYSLVTFIGCCIYVRLPNISPTQDAEFRKSLFSILGNSSNIKGSYLVEIARNIFSASISLVKGTRCKEVAWIKGFLKRKPFAGQCSEGGEFFGIGAYLAAMVGILSREEDEKRRFSSRAAGMFDKMGGTLLMKWALGELMDSITM
ncbi:hypothetical protein HDU67_009226 [Dinochytrium kinnereticum]|nr:hypothetical protein HDU67_009226 [Dinochytrium kinnereticum]